MIRIEPGSGVPLENQIRAGFKELVLRGQLKPGDALPEANHLAEMLRISPGFVTAAYDSLLKDGFLTNAPPQGFVLSDKAWSQSAHHLVDSVQEYVSAIQSSRKVGLGWSDLEAILKFVQSREMKTSPPEATEILKQLGVFGRNRSGSGQAHCPYCRAEIADPEIACCFVCGTAYHKDCWNESGRCSVYGCNGRLPFLLAE